MAHARLIAAALVVWTFAACGTSPCGLKLQQNVYLAPPIIIDGRPAQQDSRLPCCGGSVFRDIDLSTTGEIEIDITNPNGSGVDAFLTSAGCDKLFDAPYTGAGGGALCQIHVGPVRPRAISERRKIAPGRYRIFAQGYASNDTALDIALDVGLWSNACRWNPIAP